MSLNALYLKILMSPYGLLSKHLHTKETIQSRYTAVVVISLRKTSPFKLEMLSCEGPEAQGILLFLLVQASDLIEEHEGHLDDAPEVSYKQWTHQIASFSDL